MTCILPDEEPTPNTKSSPLLSFTVNVSAVLKFEVTVVPLSLFVNVLKSILSVLSTASPYVSYHNATIVIFSDIVSSKSKSHALNANPSAVGISSVAVTFVPFTIRLTSTASSSPANALNVTTASVEFL